MLLAGWIYRLATGENITSLTTTFTVEYNGDELADGTSDILLHASNNFTLHGSLFNNVDDYDVKIYAYGDADHDWSFTAYGQTYSWYDDIANPSPGTDFTDCFEITKNGTKFTVYAPTLHGIMARKYSSDVVLPDVMPTGDTFRMEITAQSTTVSFTFRVYESVTGIDLDSNEIIF
jgi:hypothetical protein